MSKVILIYANCQNSTAKGDFALAGMLAKDLAALIVDGTEVVLTSTVDGMARYEELYGKAVNGKLMIEGQPVGLGALEHFNAADHEVVAFIEANRCKYAPAELVKRVLSPDSKFLFIGAANQSVPNPAMLPHYIKSNCVDQPGIYEHFDENDTLMGACGVGAGRLGFPKLKTIGELGPLSPDQHAKIPGSEYGFMYLALVNGHEDFRMIAQFTRLSKNNQYVLIGDFAPYQAKICDQLTYDRTSNGLKATPLPMIHYYSSVPNALMRNLVFKSHGDLVLSTGVMSAVEAMSDGKLPYYQTLPNNTEFVAAYLIAVKSICSNDASLFGAMPQLIIGLSDLLYANKPLTEPQMKQTDNLLAMSSVCSKLVAINKDIMAKANGTLAGQLLSFIGKRSSTQSRTQLVSVCNSLRKPQEQNMPVYDKALRRAAAWKRLFELKVISQMLAPDELSKKEVGGHEFTALHWAVSVKFLDGVRILIKAGAYLDVKDADGHTPSYYAVQNGDKEMMQLFVDAGLSAKDFDTKNCQPWILKFLGDCFGKSPDPQVK